MDWASGAHHPSLPVVVEMRRSCVWVLCGRFSQNVLSWKREDGRSVWSGGLGCMGNYSHLPLCILLIYLFIYGLCVRGLDLICLGITKGGKRVVMTWDDATHVP